jgi:type II secretory pathway component PulK
MKRKYSIRRDDRRGLVIFAALACLMIAAALIGGMLKSAIQARRQLLTECDCRQAELLLQAGADRAAARLADDPAFRGDVWKLAADEITGSGSGQVTTEVIRGDNDSLQVRVISEYPLDRNFAVRRSRTFPITLSTSLSQE